MKKLREFDNAITAKIHGFKDADDYYHQCSALPRLPNITIPLLIIHAKDDPFMSPEVIPDTTHLPPNIEYQMTEHGGHVGFVGGSLKKPQMWLEQRIPDWLAPYLEFSLSGQSSSERSLQKKSSQKQSIPDQSQHDQEQIL
ncbi:hydrolase [Xenorhabdus hominickii]|uniref:Hydrolase n=1 Tax=Xenorhabdus hominickii TaxID=351679 RepID=A0A2G0QFK3_XENHO|nr:hydrolase [Xenorhabdus hominickii]